MLTLPAPVVEEVAAEASMRTPAPARAVAAHTATRNACPPPAALPVDEAVEPGPGRRGGGLRSALAHPGNLDGGTGARA